MSEQSAPRPTPEERARLSEARDTLMLQGALLTRMVRENMLTKEQLDQVGRMAQEMQSGGTQTGQRPASEVTIPLPGSAAPEANGHSDGSGETGDGAAAPSAVQIPPPQAAAHGRRPPNLGNVSRLEPGTTAGLTFGTGRVLSLEMPDGSDDRVIHPLAIVTPMLGGREVAVPPIEPGMPPQVRNQFIFGDSLFVLDGGRLPLDEALVVLEGHPFDRFCLEDLREADASFAVVCNEAALGLAEGDPFRVIVAGNDEVAETHYMTARRKGDGSYSYETADGPVLTEVDSKGNVVEASVWRLLVHGKVAVFDVPTSGGEEPDEQDFPQLLVTYGGKLLPTKRLPGPTRDILSELDRADDETARGLWRSLVEATASGAETATTVASDDSGASAARGAQIGPPRTFERDTPSSHQTQPASGGRRRGRRNRSESDWQPDVEVEGGGAEVIQDENGVITVSSPHGPLIQVRRSG